MDRNSLPHIAVVIPTFMAQSTIAKVLAGIPSYVQSIIVVDDGSPDGSYDEAKRGADRRTVIIKHQNNQGVGGAVLTAYNEAVRLGAEIVVKMDADGQMDPAHLPALLQPIVDGEADYTKANRFFHRRELRSMPPVRRLGNLGLSFLTKMATGYWDVFDPTNGFTAIEASVIPLLDFSCLSRRYFFESSILIELGARRAVVRDVYIPARYGTEVSQLSELQVLGEFPLKLLKGFCGRIWTQYFVRDFGLLALSLICGLFSVIFGLSFGAFHWVHSVEAGSETPVGTVMIAVLPVILGFQLLLQTVLLDVQNQPKTPIHPALKRIRDFLAYRKEIPRLRANNYQN